MDAARWRETRALFDELVELPAAERVERLASIGATDPELRDALEPLLAADARNSGVLVSPFEVWGSTALMPDPLGLAGRMISHFRVLTPLGAGGMGVVYSAEDTRLGRAVALKFPLPQYGLDPSARARFLREARSAGRLDHPNLCTIHEVGESEDGRLFLAMPLYSGKTLKERLAREGALPIEKAVEIAQQTTEGLACAHGAGIVHRDLKPGNLMLLPDGTVKVLDFGLAKARDLTLSGSDMTVGTVAYMAPEQVRGGAVDGRTDLWALGVMLYEMLTGVRPFVGENEYAVAQAVLRETPLPPSALRPEVGPDLDALVNRLLRRGDEEGFSGAAELARELSALARSSTIEARTPGHRPGLRPLRRWSRRPILLGAVSAAIGTAVLVRYALWEDAPPSPDDRRVVVAVFENQTGDSNLASLGRLAAESVTHGLSELSYLEVHDAGMIPGVWSDSGFSPALITRLVEGTAAGTLIKGSYSLEGDTIRLVGQITDAGDGRVLQRVGPVSTPRSAPHEGIDQLVSRVMAGAASIFDPQTAPWEAAPRGRTPTYEAYRAYSAGLDAYNLNAWDQSAVYFERAFELDTTFVGAAIWAALSRLLLTWGGVMGMPRDVQAWNLARADSIAAEVERRRTRLEPYDRHFFDWYLSLRDMDYNAAYFAATRMMEAAPGSYMALKEAAWAARRSHRPRKALELLERLGLETGLLRDYSEYWWGLLTVSHRLEDYDREILYAHKAQQMLPQWAHATVAEIRAHAAAGRIETAEGLVRERAAKLGGAALLEIAAEFSTHGFETESRRTLQRVNVWFKALPTEDQKRESVAWSRAEALFALGEYARAKQAYQARSWSMPTNWLAKGRLGLISFAEGDTSRALQSYQELQKESILLAQRDWPLFMARAALAARVTSFEEAAAHARELLRSARWEALHFMPGLGPLRSYPPVQALMRPIG